MKQFHNFLMAAVILLLGTATVACSDNNIDEVTANAIELKVSPSTILADGVEKAIFSVIADGETDVTASATITIKGKNTTVEGAVFSTTEEGNYTFVATYGQLTSNEVTVKANRVAAQGENEWVTTDTKTPIRYAEGNYYGTSTSVGIEIIAAEAGDLRFVLTPGEELQSYRVQFYSMAWLYNQLLNQYNLGDGSDLTPDDAEEVILSYMTNTSYAALAGELMNADLASLGDNFWSYEFDWLNMDHMSAIPWTVQPDADYLIVTLGSFDEDCMTPENFADLAICHVKTPAVQPAGDPHVLMDIKPSFTAYQITYSANADCKYMYFLSNDAAQIDQYIDFYGADMYRDFLRHYGSRVDLSAAPYVSRTNASQTLADVTYASTAIALDANGNPAKMIDREDFQLKKKPEGAARTLGTASILNFKTSSGAARFWVEMDHFTYAVFQTFYPVDEALRIMESETARAAEAIRLNDEGWGHGNKNYRLDLNSEDGMPDGEGWTDTEAYWMDLKPETEYAILYITRNGYGDISDVQMTETFTTKKQDRDSYDQMDKSAFKFWVSSTGPTKINLNIEFDPDKVCQYFFTFYEPFADGSGYDGYEYPNANSDRDTWLYWLLDFRDPVYSVPWANCWFTTEPDGKCVFTMAGYEPNTTYKWVCVYEDWEGRISEVIFSNATTSPVHYGPNPTLETTIELQENGVYKVDYMGNNDTGAIRYLAAFDTDQGNDFLLDELLARVKFLKEEDYKNAIMKNTLAIGLEALGGEAHTSFDEREQKRGNIAIIAAVGIGEDKDGNPAYTEPSIYVWTTADQKMRTLHEDMLEGEAK